MKLFPRLSSFLLLPVILTLLTMSANSVSAQSKGYDVTMYDAQVMLDRIKNTIQGQVTMTATSVAGSPLTQIVQHAKYLVIDSVFVVGRRSTITLIDSVSGTYNIETATNPISPKSQFSVTTYYHGIGRSEGGSFPWGGVTDSTGMMFAMGVGFGAPYVGCTRHWLPCYDLPDDKADSVHLSFTVADTDRVASCGLEVSNLVVHGNTRISTWHVTHPIATYLLTFAVGKFEKVSIPNVHNIPFDVYAFAKDTASLATLMRRRVADALVYYDSLFAPYPFEKVGYVLAPLGSMEHQTMITLDRSIVDTNNTTAAHELSHQWWGDRVTCKTFDDPWLNEGFATYCESLFLERYSGTPSYWTRQHSNIKGAISGGSSIPMFGAPNLTKPRNNYPYAVIYQKGAAVLGMLRYFLGDSLFFSAVRAYGNKYAYSVATSYDLWHTFDTITGTDMGWFFNKWVFGIGYPQLKIGWSASATSTTLHLEQAQDPVKIGYFRLPIVVEARSNGGKTERIPVWLDSTHFSNPTIQLGWKPDTLVIDPDGALIKKIVSVSDVSTQAAFVIPSLSLAILNNPVREHKLLISIRKHAATDSIRLSILNTAGVVMQEFGAHNLPTEKTAITEELHLASGAYVLVATTSDGHSTTEKFVIEK
jgi:aminopeptidase N